MSDLFIHSEGQGGPHLVLLHGWAMHGGVFAPLVEALRDRCTLHVVDLPGHGRSRDCNVSLQPAECAKAIAERVPPAIWLGWSLGGLHALQAALDFPEQVHGLAMLCASPRFVRAADWPHAVSPEILQDFGRDLETDYEGTLDRFLALEALGSDCAQADLRTLRADTFNEFRPQVRALTEGLDVLEHTDLRARLRELEMPSAWIAGRRDRLVPWQAMQWSADQCHGAFARIEGGGHAPFIGHVRDVIAALAPLLAAVPA
ncbi:MAG: pimeloyl-ACP methyl ester esterase BioH [Xanthomonadales bacterium]|nr:pimeloyl-ACP methyl ester esterase BioH [Xanthomonadales bacterium]ODU92609.1 MAG: pimeloyl-[acyl-carrier protein] methyl ester esterase [Rhodanobacter sp. SCN 66-43]OJY85448.1 MAG: pimeloyl-[acyl-carrier protein] methyl ester esterase [Xanthomonadales bacterium 66-474]